MFAEHRHGLSHGDALISDYELLRAFTDVYAQNELRYALF
jgi:hypothetical protein